MKPHPDQQGQRLITAARSAADPRDPSAPFGFATRVAARAFASPAPAGSLVERFALRALGVAALLAVLSVAGNYTALVSAFDNETAGLDDPVGDMIDLAS